MGTDKTINKFILEYTDESKREAEKGILFDLSEADVDKVNVVITADVESQELLKTALTFIYLLESFGLKEEFFELLRK